MDKMLLLTLCLAAPMFPMDWDFDYQVAFYPSTENAQDETNNRLYQTILYGKNNHPKTHESQIRQLIQNGADVNYMRGNCSLLYWAASMQDSIACELLLEHGADPNLNIDPSHNWRGITPLILSLHYGMKKVAHLMLEKGASIWPKDGNECNALYYACIHGYTGICALLLQRGANPNEDLNMHHKRDGKTPLMIAMAGNRVEICKLLIGYGANVKSCTQSTWVTPLICAAEAKAYESCLALIRHLLLPSKELIRYSLFAIKRGEMVPQILYQQRKALLAHYLIHALANQEALHAQLSARTKESQNAFDYFSIELLDPQSIDKTIQFIIRNELQDRPT